MGTGLNGIDQSQRIQRRIQDLPKAEGGPAGSRGRVFGEGLGGKALWWGLRGQSPPEAERARGQSLLKLKAFCPFSYKRGAKAKDLNETI